MEKIEKGVATVVVSDGDGAVTLLLSCQSEPPLRAFVKELILIAESDGTKLIESFVADSPSNAISEIELRSSQRVKSEVMDYKKRPGIGGLITWIGNSEYWSECIEKCEGLLTAGTGHQDLLMLGSASRNVVLSYRE